MNGGAVTFCLITGRTSSCSLSRSRLPQGRYPAKYTSACNSLTRRRLHKLFQYWDQTFSVRAVIKTKAISASFFIHNWPLPSSRKFGTAIPGQNDAEAQRTIAIIQDAINLTTQACGQPSIKQKQIKQQTTAGTGRVEKGITASNEK